MTKGWMIMIIFALIMGGCSLDSHHTEILETDVRHVGAETLPGWIAPEPEALEISYNFDLGRLRGERFRFLFVWKGTQNLEIEINGESNFRYGYDIEAYADSLLDPFLECWSELGENAEQISELSTLLQSHDFFPVVLEIDVAYLRNGENTIIFSAGTEQDFPPVGDYMFSHLLLSNDQAVMNLPVQYVLWR